MSEPSRRPLSARTQRLIDATETAPGGPAAAAPRPARAVGTPGLTREFERADRASLDRLTLLEEKYGKGTALPCLKLDPAEIRVGKFFNRFDGAFDAESNKDFAELLEDIRLHQGNLVAGMVRPIEGATSAPRYELVYGERRWRACAEAGVLFKAEIAEGLSAEEVIALHSVENRYRPDLSVIENAKQFRSWLDTMRRDDGSLPDGSLDALAGRLGLSRRYAQKLRAIGEIPDEVIEALSAPTRLTGRVASVLAEACRTNLAGVKANIKKLPANGDMSPKDQALYLAGAKQKTGGGAAEPRTIAWPSDAETARLLLSRLRAIENELEIDLGLAD